MRLGHNHNVMYRGEVYHVQTEDSGIKNPHIITLLYQGGTILASKKTTYADIVTFENLDLLVDELMKEQHKGMLRGLKNGDYDDKIDTLIAAPAAAAAASQAEAEAVAAVVDEPLAAEVPVVDDEVADMDDLIAQLEVQIDKPPAKSLDDAILDFFAIK